MLNLCIHQSDFGFDACWSFFATSHGKSSCDGVGETVKRLSKMASLRRSESNQITTVPALFDYHHENISGTIFEYLQSDNLQRNRHKMATRFLLGNTILGTRPFHHFESLTISLIGYKQSSQDNHLSGILIFLTALQHKLKFL